MPSKTFTKEYMQETAIENAVYNEIEGTRRWSINYYMVFPFEGKFYSARYSVGATESQDERPFEYDDDQIECPEVHEVEVVKKVWKNV